MKNSINDLRNHLFETIELLKEKQMDPSEAKAITSAAQAIINSAKVEVDFIRALGGINEGTGFIPLETKRPELKR